MSAGIPYPVRLCGGVNVFNKGFKGVYFYYSLRAPVSSLKHRFSPPSFCVKHPQIFEKHMFSLQKQ
ncbi:hypothetical protein BGLA2_1710026 [Burkholderia gladioli]|nr:hypothetical protein BGLA2_1710026 [Burkholderia gladioli]